MDVKIGLAESPRELVISSGEKQEDIVAEVSAAIEAGRPTVTLVDDKGRKFVIRTERISYVEVGNSTARAVGFVG
ncbi:hypothetical protein CAPI_02405 [Corynebacterium capitovis DSM 44611]|uniref:DUF3107 domain-containing protein n=1 Tax=Corynebacterium capitovis TaxID=131081 RepID=UPI000364C467|nr:DUF3107 domain-containing protein [Corynebacterium capitovis]WKD57055.1 hypothetical protein CAPI_02405 [Corynebacterium capitovis DSM 44611]